MNNNPAPPPDEHEELVHADDAIIGKAVRGSVVVAVAMAVVVIGVVFILKRQPAPSPQQITQISAPTVPGKPNAEIPAVRFTDVTREAGITFVHNNGAYGEKLLPETMGGGVAFFDFDNDGAPDLLFINSTYWPWHVPEGAKPTTHALYHNDGKGRFTDVTAGSGLDVSFYGMGVAIGDYDNDGLEDVFITAVGGNHLFHNEGKGKFKEVTSLAGLGTSTQDWSTCAAWIDYDNDGKLDLFVGNYVKWSRKIDAEVGYKIDGQTRAYGQPNNFEGTFPSLYHNEGNGRFNDVSAQSGVQIKNPSTGVPAAKTLGVAPVDLDGDGWIDLVVANDTVPNFVFLNQRDGRFKEIGALCGIAFDSFGNTRGAMGIDAARYRNDDKLGIAIGNFANEMTALYVAQNAPTNFADEAITEGIGPASRLLLKFGVFFFDYDLDGWLDLLSANGHLEEEIQKIQQSQRYRQPAQLFWNAGGAGQGGFLLVPPEKCGGDISQPVVGRGSAYADIDGDGDLDVVVTQINGPPLLLRNDQQLRHHWLRFKLAGTRSNRDAIGAWAQARVHNRTLSQQVMPTRSYLSQSELPVTLGLGNVQQPDEVTIVWPDGSKQKLESARVDATTIVQQSQ
ncbi:MAG: CRTAC1 family protein [Verrucomicrobia bacterium]|nr:MAG: CRTAC1 family protein [Verrucomicrobiota bacterium]